MTPIRRIAVLACAVCLAAGFAVGARDGGGSGEPASGGPATAVATPTPIGDREIEERFAAEAPSRLRVRTRDDVARTRARLQSFVLGRRPREVPPARVEGDRLVTRLPHGLRSIATVRRPARPSGLLVLAHDGHAPPGEGLEAATQHLLAHGATVVTLQMPLTGENPRPVVRTTRGTLRLTQHDQLGLLRDRHPVRPFLEPVAAVLNRMSREREWKRIALVGLSGGGWTATVYAALDPRVERSYPVAGSLPFPLQFQGIGDYEQRLPALYDIADYLDLYVLGAAGAGRRQLQLLTERDPCCFGGTGYRAYEDAVAGRASALGGSFAVSLDTEATVHAITPAHLAAISRDLALPVPAS